MQLSRVLCPMRDRNKERDNIYAKVTEYNSLSRSMRAKDGTFIK